MSSAFCARLICWIFVFAGFTIAVPSVAAEEAQPFAIEDYFNVKQVSEIAISFDGEMIVYALEWQSLAENQRLRRIFLSATSPGDEPEFIEELTNATSLAWIARSYEVAFLAERNGHAQVYSVDARSRKIRQHTRSDVKVSKYSFGPEGEVLAYLTEAKPSVDSEAPSENLYDGQYYLLHYGAEGIVVDTNNTSLYDFVDPNRPDRTKRLDNQLWLKANGHADGVPVPGRVTKFHWSPDGQRLSVLYVAEEVPEEAYYGVYTSLGVYDVSTKTFNVIARAQAGALLGKGIYYAGGEWIPGTGSLHIRRVVERNAWHSKAQWTLADADAALDDDAATWSEIEHSSADVVVAADPDRLYIRKTVEAVDGLYTLTRNGLARAPMIRDVAGTTMHFQFSADFRTAVFVNEDLTSPPEIFVWREGGGAEPLTRLNSAVGQRRMPAAREVTWNGQDGTLVHGWIIAPPRTADGPMPVLTFVHGGPGVPMRNAFSSYWFRGGGLWPYPFEVYALNGIAVFMPNYRGTRSYGDAFSDPKSIDVEPVGDIVSGIEHLVAEGFADPDRLAISGHSHGAWLAPLVVARTRTLAFQAGSFAEGTQNRIINYSLMPGYLNRVTHDVQFGASLLEDPERYVQLSPDLHFERLSTAMLFEAGAQSLAVAMLGSPKAASRAGMPAEFVVYPKTGHNIRTPRLQRESAIRNLDWFRFWLKGEEDPDASKFDQYARWRAMRGNQCERLKGDDAPWYCKPGALDETATKH